MGAAAVLPNTLALLVDGLPDGPRRRAIAVWAAMTGLAAVLGNVGGGAAIEYGSWRALFVCVVPVASAALVLVAVVAPVAGGTRGRSRRWPPPCSPAGSWPC
ncbi:MFS transporter [Streptomyces albulus]|nr:MFS transporter [Streptomyces noursei]